MKRLITVTIFVFLCSSCIIQKEISIVINDSNGVGVDSAIQGSALDDIKPSLSIPLIP